MAEDIVNTLFWLCETRVRVIHSDGVDTLDVSVEL